MLPSWLVGVLRLLGIRRAADVVPVARELAEQLTPAEGQPLPYTHVRHIQDQIASATEPRTGNPSRVVAASAPAAGAVCEAPRPRGAGAAGTQGGQGPSVAKAVDRTAITTRPRPPRPPPKDRKK
jgi:hypothetical protein